MLKKSLLIGSAVLLASTPLLVATEKRDIFTFGSDSVTGGQSVTDFTPDSSAATDIVGTNTGVGALITNQTQGATLIRPYLSGGNWTNQRALDSLKEATGLDKSSFSGLKNGAYYTGAAVGGRGPVITFSDFTAGQEYIVSFIIKTGNEQNNANLALVKDRTHNLTGLECYYGLLSGSGWDESTGTYVEFTGKAQEYLVTYRFTANEGANFNVYFSNTGGTPPSMDLGMIAISTIPEPSAFGLLAGVGALALTVSRRRRK